MSSGPGLERQDRVAGRAQRHQGAAKVQVVVGHVDDARRDEGGVRLAEPGLEALDVARDHVDVPVPEVVRLGIERHRAAVAGAR